MHINDKGLGESLIYPFYSTESGNDTYIHVANTTAYSKAVKVRFIDAYNSAEVLDFNLYLSPEDVWTAAITNLEDGSPGIRSVDNSCTVPELGGPNPPFDGSQTDLGNGVTLREQPFVNFKFLEDAQSRFLDAPSGDDAETEITDIAIRGTQGYIEIIEMGALDPDTDDSTADPGQVDYDYNGAVLHDEDGVPANCSALVAAWSSIGVWATNSPSDEDFLAYDDDPLSTGSGSAGGLYGLGQVINTTDGTMASYDAVAIDDFQAPGALAGVLHFLPGDNRPDLGNGQSTVTIFDGAAAVDYTFDIDPITGNPYNPASALFMSTQIINDYLIDPAVAGQTDWVLTMPTKRPHVDGTTANSLDDRGTRPFVSVWDGEKACEPFSIRSWDREEAFVPSVIGGSNFSPRPPQAPAGPDPVLCSEVNLLTFNDGDNTDGTSALYGSAGILQGYGVAYNEGWARLSFDEGDLNAPLKRADLAPNDDSKAKPRTIEDGGGTLFYGLPVTGFAVLKYKDESGTNVSSEGAVLNYAGSFKHKVVTSIN